MTVYCARCGASNPELAETCSACGARLVRGGVLGETAQAIDKAARKPIGSILLLIVCLIYLLNPILGLEFLPDYIPVIGNLDEAAVTYLLLLAMSRLGWFPFPRRKP